jgi:2,3-bisphosphoglycerate-independent phosphoglycerate mutase
MRRLDGEEFVVAVTADHSTPCELKAHSDDPVPVLVCGGLEPEGAEGFSERVARNGWLGRLQGKELVPKLVSLSK